MAVLSIEYIVSTPDVFSGEPHIAGKRIRVRDIAMWHQNGATVEKIVQQFDVTIAEVHAALSYYYDHRDEIEAYTQWETEFADRHLADGKARTTDDLKARIVPRRRTKGQRKG